MRCARVCMRVSVVALRCCLCSWLNSLCSLIIPSLSDLDTAYCIIYTVIIYCSMVHIFVVHVLLFLSIYIDIYSSIMHNIFTYYLFYFYLLSILFTIYTIFLLYIQYFYSRMGETVT